MKLHIEYENDEDRNVPINFAKAIIDFSDPDNELEYFGDAFLETVEYLNVKARALKRKRRGDNAWNIS